MASGFRVSVDGLETNGLPNIACHSGLYSSPGSPPRISFSMERSSCGGGTASRSSVNISRGSPEIK